MKLHKYQKSIRINIINIFTNNNNNSVYKVNLIFVVLILRCCENKCVLKRTLQIYSNVTNVLFHGTNHSKLSVKGKVLLFCLLNNKSKDSKSWYCFTVSIDRRIPSHAIKTKYKINLILIIFSPVSNITLNLL